MLARVTFWLALIYLLLVSSLDNFIQSIKGSWRNKQDVCSIHWHTVAPNFAGTPLWDINYSALKNFQQALNNEKKDKKKTVESSENRVPIQTRGQHDSFTTLSTSPSSKRIGDGRTLEASALLFFCAGNLSLINSFDTRFSCFPCPQTRCRNFFRNLTYLLIFYHLNASLQNSAGHPPLVRQIWGFDWWMTGHADWALLLWCEI